MMKSKVKPARLRKSYKRKSKGSMGYSFWQSGSAKSSAMGVNAALAGLGKPELSIKRKEIREGGFFSRVKRALGFHVKH